MFDHIDLTYLIELKSLIDFFPLTEFRYFIFDLTDLNLTNLNGLTELIDSENKDFCSKYKWKLPRLDLNRHQSLKYPK